MNESWSNFSTILLDHSGVHCGGSQTGQKTEVFFWGGGWYKGLGLFFTRDWQNTMLFSFQFRSSSYFYDVTSDKRDGMRERKEGENGIYIYMYIKRVSQRKYFFSCCRLLYVHFVITGEIHVKSVTSYCGSVKKKQHTQTLPCPSAHVIYFLRANQYWTFYAFWAQSVYTEHIRVMESPVVIIPGCFRTILPYRTIHYHFSKTRSNLNYI